jgi:large subunit ribosomal protein L27
MATKKGQGSTKNGRNSNPKYLGVKKYSNEYVKTGNIVIRQRGTKFLPGFNIGCGKDHTLYALKNGYVSFQSIYIKKKRRVKISIL